MNQMLKKAMAITIVAVAVGAVLGTATVMIAHADGMYDALTLQEVTVAIGTGHGITAHSILMVSDPRWDCWIKCRNQGGLKSDCRRRCGIPPEG